MSRRLRHDTAHAELAGAHEGAKSLRAQNSVGRARGCGDMMGRFTTLDVTMMDPQPNSPAPEAWRFSPRAFLAGEWPYLLMLILALFGVAYSSFAKSPLTTYWIILAPFIGLICIITRWQDAEGREQRLRLIWTQALHWGAVLLAMRLMFVADVGRMMNADASALGALTILALGTFTAGVHIVSWRICLVGILLATGVPAIAWLEESALLILLVVVVLAAVIAPFFWRDKRESKQRPADGEQTPAGG